MNRHAVETIPSTIAALGVELADTAMAAPVATAPALRGDQPDAPRYARESPLGQGGMGVVERARDRDLLREVAIKLLRPELRRDAALLEQFLWEARVTAYLDHPNIVPVHDIGLTPEGQLFFTMKLVRGTTLAAALADSDHAGELGLRRRLRVFAQLCQAVSFAHAHGVLHRDLKPANVMVGEFGEVLVTDWGLALPIDGEAGRKLQPLVPPGIATRSAGTPSYMSPEQARGEPLDERSDVYTLGVILYELVALRRAYDGPTAREIIDRVMAGDAPPLPMVAPRTPRAIAAVVARAMATDAADRYPSVRALAADLEIAMEGGTPQAENAGLVTQLGRFYMARVSGPGQMGELRHIDVDTWMLGAALIGGGLGVVLAPWLAPAWWALLAGGALIAAVPTFRWLRLRRRERAARDS